MRPVYRAFLFAATALSTRGPIARYREAVVHLSVAVGRFFEALLYAIFNVAAWVMLEVIASAAILIGLILLARRLLKGDRRP